MHRECFFSDLKQGLDAPTCSSQWTWSFHCRKGQQMNALFTVYPPTSCSMGLLLGRPLQQAIGLVLIASKARGGKQQQCDAQSWQSTSLVGLEGVLWTPPWMQGGQWCLCTLILLVRTWRSLVDCLWFCVVWVPFQKTGKLSCHQINFMMWFL
jgi:hypothetical protein